MVQMKMVQMKMVQMGRDRGCTLCDLHEGCKTRCIPTTLYGLQKRHKRAVLIVGEAPGATEALKDQPFTGKSGNMLRKVYVDFFHLEDKADIYLGNAARCRPPGNRTPNKTQLKSCHGFLLADVIRLQQEYNEVLVLAVGAPAASALFGCSLKQAFHRQGEFTDWHNLLKWGDEKTKFEDMALDIVEEQGLGWDPIPAPTRVFSTYHPSFLLREPSAGLAVKRHLQMMVDYLDGKLDYELDEQLEISVAPLPVKYPIGRLSLDIETYGIVKSYPNQQYFHPRKSHKLDHVDPSDLVQTTGLTWRDSRGEMRHAIFFMDDVSHRRRLWAWLKKCRDEEGFEYLLGQNIVFDLMYLRYAHREARTLLDDPLPIMDLMILNYLHDESRPEKSLKALAPLFRVSKYGEGQGKNKGEYKRYENNRVPELIQYNCQDTASTLRIAEKLESEIKGFYGKDTKKLQPLCMQWYSQLLWLIVWMSEDGLCMEKSQLTTLFDKYKGAQNAIMRCARELYDMPLRGVGSEKAKRAMMERACDFLVANGIRLPDLEVTDKKCEIRFSADNRNALMAVMDRDWDTYKQLKLFGAYQDVSGMMDRYLYPLLIGGGKKHDQKGTVLLDGFAYPKWFPVPSEFEDKSTGGTKQARIVAKGPPCQTFPPAIKKCLTGRFSDGWMVWFDYSQIELRVAALLSGDSAMMEEYRGDPDLHGKTAQLMFGDDIINDPAYKSKYRQAGKKFNFRALYRGGAEKAQSVLMKDLGIHLDLHRIEEIDRAFWARHAGLRQWQESLVAHVQRKGHYELPLIGQSRLFLGGRRAKNRKLNEIVNLPVQALAADIMLSAQYHLWAAFRREGLKAVVPCNIYDAALIECPKYEIHAVRRLMKQILPRPSFYVSLCSELGRELPLGYEVVEKNLDKS
jgi:uracil-DNA glycosylase family 4